MSERPERIYDQAAVDETDFDERLDDPRFDEPTVAQPTTALRHDAGPEPLVIRPANGDPVVVSPTTTSAAFYPTEAVHVERDVTQVQQVQPTHVVAPAVTTVPLQPSGAVETSLTRSFAPDAVVAALVGLFVLIVGLLAITRGGFDAPIDQPIVNVVGFTHTTLLGLIEIVIGTCLLLSGATRSRSAAMFFGSVLGIAAFVGAVQTQSFDELALESGFAWLLVVASLLVVLTALFAPRYMRHSRVVYPA